LPAGIRLQRRQQAWRGTSLIPSPRRPSPARAPKEVQPAAASPAAAAAGRGRRERGPARMSSQTPPRPPLRANRRRCLALRGSLARWELPLRAAPPCRRQAGGCRRSCWGIRRLRQQRLQAPERLRPPLSARQARCPLASPGTAVSWDRGTACSPERRAAVRWRRNGGGMLRLAFALHVPSAEMHMHVTMWAASQNPLQLVRPPI
jgi:hypothetical protein